MLQEQTYFLLCMLTQTHSAQELWTTRGAGIDRLEYATFQPSVKQPVNTYNEYFIDFLNPFIRSCLKSVSIELRNGSIDVLVLDE